LLPSERIWIENRLTNTSAVQIFFFKIFFFHNQIVIFHKIICQALLYKVYLIFIVNNVNIFKLWRLQGENCSTDYGVSVIFVISSSSRFSKFSWPGHNHRRSIIKFLYFFKVIRQSFLSFAGGGVTSHVWILNHHFKRLPNQLWLPPLLIQLTLFPCTDFISYTVDYDLFQLKVNVNLLEVHDGQHPLPPPLLEAAGELGAGQAALLST
jgi:hypothetical protein